MTARAKLHQMFEILNVSYDASDWWQEESPLEVICGAILVQNTTWGNAYTALTQLIKSEKLCINQINEMEIVELEQLIRSSGTYKAKAQALKGLAELVVTTDEGTLDAFLKIKTSDLKTALISVKGIGDETADDIILYAARRPVFVIDKFTKRILSRYGLTPTRNSYRSWQEFLHRNIEEDTLKFQRFHAFLVMLAQQYCKTKPQCSTCVLKERCFTGCKVLV